MKIQRKKVRIKDMPLTLRPREKLFAHGAHNLSETELLAILLGTGSAKVNALKLSEKLLRELPLRKMSEDSLKQIVKYPGVGIAKASRIAAALELGERLFAPLPVTKIIVKSAQDVISQVRDIADKKQEYLIVLYLNARQELVLKEVVGMGSLNSLQITPKEISVMPFKHPVHLLLSFTTIHLMIQLHQMMISILPERFMKPAR